MTNSQKLKIYLNKISEDWIIDRTYKEWYKANNSISTKYQQRSNLIWIIAPWTWNKLNKKNFEIVKDVNLSELCITSSAQVEKIEQNEVLVETEKAKGNKCSVCWKISVKPCERHGA